MPSSLSARATRSTVSTSGSGAAGSALVYPHGAISCLSTWDKAGHSTAGFYALHALVHVIDTLRGLVGPEHWAIDFPGVYLPAVILIAVTWLVARAR